MSADADRGPTTNPVSTGQADALDVATLAAIPLPEKRCEVTIRSHTQAYPTAPGCVSGIVEHVARGGRTTVQCAVCLRTATGHRVADPIIHAGWNHTSDDYDTLRGPLSQPTPYKRCPDCRAARRHPQEKA